MTRGDSGLSETLRAVVVDDERPARIMMRESLGEIAGVEVVGEAANGLEAVRLITEEQPDVVFLDVRMPKIDGFDVVELLEIPRGRVARTEDAAPEIVFVTAYDDQAVRAFEVEAVDYLLKPVDVGRMAAAVQRVRERRQRGEHPPVPSVSSPSEPLARILVREGGAIHVVRPEEVDWIEARDDAVVLKLRDGRELKKQVTLGELEGALDPGRFLRVHRSYLLNVDRLTGLELYAKDSRVALVRGGGKIPVSRAGYSRLRELL